MITSSQSQQKLLPSPKFLPPKFHLKYFFEVKRGLDSATGGPGKAMPITRTGAIPIQNLNQTPGLQNAPKGLGQPNPNVMMPGGNRPPGQMIPGMQPNNIAPGMQGPGMMPPNLQPQGMAPGFMPPPQMMQNPNVRPPNTIPPPMMPRPPNSNPPGN